MTKSKHAIIGTAGHVDHGKTSLIKALTGIDTDRLAEEKKRGITIETGYAHLNLPGNHKAGIIDVPGHERFIKNMLAGAAGIDLAMLIVALDDGVMPQTVEHLDILQLLGVRYGLVVLTKCDLVDEDWAELIQDDVKRLISGTFLESAPLIKVSAHTNEGLDNLKNTLSGMISSFKSSSHDLYFRLPLDRVFSQGGFGTVVTGTLMDAPVKSGETAMIYPAQIPVKIKGIQVHSETVDIAWPGQRVAVNLNIKKDELIRGDVLAAHNSLLPTMMLDVRLTCLENSPFPIKNNSWVHLYLGAREELAKVILLNQEELAAGETCYAQLRLQKSVTAKREDHFVVRFYSPVTTIGGGIVLDPGPQKRRRYKDCIIKALETKESGSPIERLELAIKERPGSFPSLYHLLIFAGLDHKRIKNDANILEQKGQIINLAGVEYIHITEMTDLKEKLTSKLSHWHENNPFSLGMSLEELRRRLVPQATACISNALFKLWEKEKLIVREQNFVRLYGFIPRVNEDENELIEKISQLYQGYGMTPLATVMVEQANNPASERKRQAAFAALSRRGELIKLDQTYFIHKTHYSEALARFKKLSLAGSVTLGQYRDELKTSRKVAVAILEHFDRLNITKTLDGGRILR